MERTRVANQAMDVAHQGTEPGVPTIRERGRPTGESGSSTERVLWLAAAVTGIVVLAWALLAVVIGPVPFAVVSGDQDLGTELTVALARFFAALVLFLFPSERVATRLQWVAAGLLLLGLGSLFFGYVPNVQDSALNLNQSVYESVLVRALAGIAFAIGLVPKMPPAFTTRKVAVLGLSFAAIGALSAWGMDFLPPLVEHMSLAQAETHATTILPGLTAWHWIFSIIPLVLSVVALERTVKYSRDHAMGTWLVLAMILWAGSQLHNLLWPSAYTPILTTGEMLRLAFTLVLVVGAVAELRRIAAERAVLLAREQEHSRRLEDLAALKADFTRMVTHELSSPVVAIRGFAAMLATRELGASAQAEAVAMIRTQTDLLANLIADVQTSATVERDDFDLAIRPVSLKQLLLDSALFAQMLPGDHQVEVSVERDVAVQADPARIAQVLYNLLSNAAKYSPSGTLIELRAVCDNKRVDIHVVDHGPGIDSEEVTQIFEKFRRGRSHAGTAVPGVGLGLYVSQRIVRAHGSRLRVASELGAGSVFSFDLPIAP